MEIERSDVAYRLEELGVDVETSGCVLHLTGELPVEALEIIRDSELEISRILGPRVEVTDDPKTLSFSLDQWRWILDFSDELQLMSVEEKVEKMTQMMVDEHADSITEARNRVGRTRTILGSLAQLIDDPLRNRIVEVTDEQPNRFDEVIVNEIGAIND